VKVSDSRESVIEHYFDEFCAIDFEPVVNVHEVNDSTG
jgi:hypothetical protein